MKDATGLTFSLKKKWKISTYFEATTTDKSHLNALW